VWSSSIDQCVHCVSCVCHDIARLLSCCSVICAPFQAPSFFVYICTDSRYDRHGILVWEENNHDTDALRYDLQVSTHDCAVYIMKSIIVVRCVAAGFNSPSHHITSRVCPWSVLYFSVRAYPPPPPHTHTHMHARMHTPIQRKSV
jgi:hypothetical protein